MGPGGCRRAVKDEKQCRVLAWMLFHWEKIGASVWGCVLREALVEQGGAVSPWLFEEAVTTVMKCRGFSPCASLNESVCLLVTAIGVRSHLAVALDVWLLVALLDLGWTGHLGSASPHQPAGVLWSECQPALWVCVSLGPQAHTGCCVGGWSRRQPTCLRCVVHSSVSQRLKPPLPASKCTFVASKGSVCHSKASRCGSGECWVQSRALRRVTTSPSFLEWQQGGLP